MPEKNNVNFEKLESDSQQDMIQRFQLGHEDAYVQIIEKYNSQVYALANRLLGWPCQVEDIVQDVFLAVLINRRKFRANSSIRTWLFTITVNKCRSWKYRQVLWRKFSKNHSYQNMAVGSDAHFEQREKIEQIRNAVQKLPFKYRQVVVLRYLNELETAEITEILGISNSALKTRLSRARVLLKDHLQDIVEEK
jgi:RNA polymerase sigma-70 factor (ECF subfamily)